MKVSVVLVLKVSCVKVLRSANCQFGGDSAGISVGNTYVAIHADWARERHHENMLPYLALATSIAGLHSSAGRRTSISMFRPMLLEALLRFQRFQFHWKDRFRESLASTALGF